jgi:K+-transporting ATPase ATPase C chain
MLTILRPAATLLGLLTLVTGVVYPLAVTGASQAIFPSQANGSVITVNGRVIGSSLIGQPFDDPRYFWGRPSATSPAPYNASASTGSNLGPSHPALAIAIRERVEALRTADPEAASTLVPIDLVTTSGSGLDPHISPAAALYQVRRVARARGLAETRVRALVEAHVEGRTLGIFGEPRVNVLLLNLALDEATRTDASLDVLMRTLAG